jgi:putative membrane protein
VFILENTKRVKVSFFGASGHLPLGVALLLAAVAGALVLAISGAARVLQLRRGVRKRR